MATKILSYYLESNASRRNNFVYFLQLKISINFIDNHSIDNQRYVFHFDVSDLPNESSVKLKFVLKNHDHKPINHSSILLFNQSLIDLFTLIRQRRNVIKLYGYYKVSPNLNGQTNILISFHELFTQANQMPYLSYHLTDIIRHTSPIDQSFYDSQQNAFLLHPGFSIFLRKIQPYANLTIILASLQWLVKREIFILHENRCPDVYDLELLLDVMFSHDVLRQLIKFEVKSHSTFSFSNFTTEALQMTGILFLRLHNQDEVNRAQNSLLHNCFLKDHCLMNLFIRVILNKEYSNKINIVNFMTILIDAMIFATNSTKSIINSDCLNQQHLIIVSNENVNVKLCLSDVLKIITKCLNPFYFLDNYELTCFNSV